MDRTLSRTINTHSSEIKQGRRSKLLENGTLCNSGRSTLTRQTLATIDSMLSTSEVRDVFHSSEVVTRLLEAFSSLVLSCEEDEIGGNKSAAELGNVAIRILAAVERTDNFQSHFCKLLPSIGVISRRNLGTWRQAICPIFNVFANKKLDFGHLKRSIKELKSISKSGDRAEMATFARQNLHLLQKFYKLAHRAGDFLLQMDILEIVFMYTAGDKSLAEAILASGSRSSRKLLENLNFFDFERDSRIFLNALNVSFGEQKRIFSINCNLVYFGNKLLSAPLRMDGIWMDVNRDSMRITISCSNFFSNFDRSKCVILQLPVSEIEKLKLEFGALSGDECFCITIKIGSLTDMYEFAKGHAVVCTGLRRKNPQGEILDFVRVAEELSATNKERGPSAVKRKNNGDCDKYEYRVGTGRTSCTSPATFTIREIDEHVEKGRRRWNHTSITSPLMLPTRSSLTCSTEKDNEQSEEDDVESASALKQIRFQTNRTRSLGLEVPLPTGLSCSSNDRGGRIVPTGGDEFSNGSELEMEKERVPGDMFFEEESASGENEENRQIRAASREWQQELERKCQDFIPTQKFRMPTKCGKSDVKMRKGRSQNQHTGSEGSGKQGKARKENCRPAGRKRQSAGELRKTSLLDPNGYAYRRWMRPTTSDRSNFWLKKLNDPQKAASKPEKDVFQFTEEGLSDDSNVFMKEKKVGGRKKWSPPSGNESKQNGKMARPGIVGREERARVTTTMRYAGKWARLESVSKESTVQVKSPIQMGTGKGSIGTRNQVLGECFDIPDGSVFNGNSKNQEKSGQGGKQSKPYGRSGTRGKTCSGGKKPSPLPTPLGNEAKTGYMDEMEDVTKRLSSGFEHLMEEVREREAGLARKCAVEAEARIKALADEEEQEMAKRCKRFELCIQYFFQGCSTSDSRLELQEEMEKVMVMMENVKRTERGVEERVKGMAGKLREIIAERTDASLGKRLKNARIHQLQQLFS